jgi:homospermidine synthase
MLLRHAAFAVCLGSLQCLSAHAQESQRRLKILQPEEMKQAQEDQGTSLFGHAKRI